MSQDLAGISLGELRALVAEGKKKAPYMSRRLDQAAFILVAREIRVIGPYLTEVESESREGAFYRITGEECNCRDYQMGLAEMTRFKTHAPGGFCKHKVCLWLQATLEAKVRARLDGLNDKLQSLLPSLEIAVHS